MTRALRIAVADDERDMRDYFQTILPLLGHEVVAAAANGRDLIEHCRALKPELVITDIKMPDMDGIEAAAVVCRERPLPVILVTAHHEADLVNRAAAEHVLAYLVKPIEQSDLEPAIAIAMSRFEHFQAASREADDLRQAMEDRKIIDKAKRALMKRSRIDEPAAFRRLQKTASRKNCKLVEIAHLILTAEEAYHQGEEAAGP